MSNAPRIDRLDRNYLINSNFDFWQRNSAADSRTGTGSSIYGADRWKVFPSSTINNSAHMQQIASTNPGSQYDMNFGPFGANEKMGAAQIVEFDNTKLLRGKEVTFAVTVKSGAASNLRLELLAWTGTSNAVTAFTNAVPYTNWNTYTLAAGFTSIAVTAFTSTTGYVQYRVTGTVPANCNNLVCIISYAQDAGQQHYASQAVLVVGNIPSPQYSMAGRDIAEEFYMCQRYYRNFVHVPATATNATTVSSYLNLNPVMVKAPTAAVNGTQLLNAQNGTDNTTQSSPSLSVGFSGVDFVIMTMANFGGMTTGRPMFVGVTANNSNSIRFDAEL